jgi:hypothetical protein
MNAAVRVAYVDIDDTMVRSAGSKRIPIPAVIRYVRALHEVGTMLFCWSSGGADYARQSAEELGVVECFAAFLPKPNLLIDDQAPADWRNCRHMTPFDISAQNE